jgi:hypothetical protein
MPDLIRHPGIRHPSAGKKVEHIPQLGTWRPVHLGKSAVFATDGREAFVLHIENLGKHTAGGTKLIGLIIPVTTLGALPISVSHDFLPDPGCCPAC